MQLPEVEQCAVIGIPDEHAGEVPRAYVILKKGTHLCAEDIHKIIEGIAFFNMATKTPQQLDLQK